MRDVVSPSLRARLLPPRADLASLIFAAIIRDTRGAGLGDGERYNHFPASPLCSVTFVQNGRLHLVSANGAIAAAPLPGIFVAGPYSRPLTSWSPDGVRVLTIGLYSDALRALTGADPGSLRERILELDALPSNGFADLLRSLAVSDDLTATFEDFQDRAAPLWRNARPARLHGFSKLEDWTRAIAARAAINVAGSRQSQRRVKSWTGLSLRELRLYARVEGVWKVGGNKDLAQTALEAGYADQSHMGREVRRVTGEPPARIARLIATDERYWVYRLFSTRR